MESSPGGVTGAERMRVFVGVTVEVVSLRRNLRSGLLKCFDSACIYCGHMSCFSGWPILILTGVPAPRFAQPVFNSY